MPISKRNRRGLFLLLLLGILVAYMPRILIGYAGEEELEISFEEIVRLEEEIKEHQAIKKVKKKKIREEKFLTPKQAFNPNDYSKKDWMKLGLSEKQAAVVCRFSQRGLSSNEDLENIFVLPKELFNKIKDSTFYPELKQEKPVFEKKVIESVELNSVTREALIDLPGIGAFYADKIISYRENLGGYVSIEQLREIWKFEEYVHLEHLEQFLTVDSRIIERLDLNNSTFEQLKNHPYISYSVANSIVKMRKAHGDYYDLEELLESKLIDRELFEKIRTYLKVEQ
ncbi:MAG: helix-hairpin-helix domain-containing protein [Crocinitomicaceae bacterium]|jgi:DNA uptake protein ComE-like DNA-binding protein|nr:helix-hairpin-helix domain-containing protein [Crocinitomicaceae bacterium]MDG1741292.1 helix-hairpin-helix domain-containing protein [Crocinitomicaceae bacterium]